MAKLVLPHIPRSIMFKDGVMTIEWHEFFRSLYERVGGIDTLDISSMLEAIVSGVFKTPNLLGALKEIEEALSLITVTEPTRRVLQGLKYTDSPSFNSVKLSALSDGKVPYNSTADGLKDSPLSTDGTDATASGVFTASMLRQSSTWHAYGGFQLADITLTLTTKDDWYHITNVTNDLWVGTEVDDITVSGDIFTIVNAGDYTGVVSITFSDLANRDFRIRLYNITTSTVSGYIIGETTSGAANYACVTLPLYIEAAAGDTFRLELTCTSVNAATPVIRSAIFTMVYLHS